MNKPGNTPIGNTINSRRKRQRLGPRLFAIGAIIFVLGGIAILVNALIGPGKPITNMLASETPTPTVTNTATSTATATATSTETMTPTITNTPTPSAPFIYTILEGDNLVLIAEKFQLAEDGIPLILDLNPAIAEAKGIIYPGQQILIPNPAMKRPTATPIPASLGRGTKLSYTILPGDTLAGIAAKFNSTVEAIMALPENKIKITDPNALQAYDVIIIPVNMITATATRPSTSTPLTPSPTGTKTP
jgi:LysM repeat protein